MSSREFELIARLAPYLARSGEGVPVGHGDDAAVVALGGGDACLTVDTVVEGRHFRLGVSSPEDVGWKAVAVAVSDVAAMGGRPVAVVVGLCRPVGFAEDDLVAVYRGMDAACRRWRISLVGGDTVASEVLSLSVAALGVLDAGTAVTRGGARPGDELLVVGPLGAATTALAQVDAGEDPDPQLLEAHRRPVALVAAGRILARHGATAMIDVSDGLGADLGHLCAASGVRARVDAAALPIAAGVSEGVEALGGDLWPLVCGGGDDYALLAAVPRGRAEAAARDAGQAEQVQAAVVGEILEGGASPLAVLELPDGRSIDLTGLGYDHFADQGGP